MCVTGGAGGRDFFIVRVRRPIAVEQAPRAKNLRLVAAEREFKENNCGLISSQRFSHSHTCLSTPCPHQQLPHWRVEEEHESQEEEQEGEDATTHSSSRGPRGGGPSRQQQRPLQRHDPPQRLLIISSKRGEKRPGSGVTPLRRRHRKRRSTKTTPKTTPKTTKTTRASGETCHPLLNRL